MTPPGRDKSDIYNVFLSPDEKGTFLVTCDQLPDLVTFGESEEEAFQMAELAMLEALGPRQGSSDFPY